MSVHWDVRSCIFPPLFALNRAVWKRIHATWNVGFSLIFKIHLLKLCFPVSGIIPAICDWSFFRIKRDVGSLSCSDVLLLQLRAQGVNSLCCMTAHFTVIHPPSIIMLHCLIQLITTQQCISSFQEMFITQVCRQKNRTYMECDVLGSLTCLVLLHSF